MKSKLTLSAAFVLFGLSANAQSEVDASIFSRLTPGGTARSIAVGGGMSAIGADMGAMGVNPASLAFYRRSELSITPGMYFTNTESALNGFSYSGNRNQFIINNAGLVLASSINEDNDARPWKSIAFGINYNRTANFHDRFYNKSNPTTGSITERWANTAGTNAPNSLYPYDESLAYQSYLIDRNADGTYSSAVPSGTQLIKSEDYSVKGGIGELQMALASNYKNKLYIGGSLGLAFLDYEVASSYSEKAANPRTTDLRELTYNYSYRTTTNKIGSDRNSSNNVGVNLKLGAVYRFDNNFRLGIAFHTPTWWTLRDTFSARLSANLYVPSRGNSYDGTVSSAMPGTYEYSYSSPLRGVLSAGYIIKKVGFIQAEVEAVNYGAGRFSLGNNDRDYERDLNQRIKDKYQSTINARVGGEFVLDVFRVRAGYAYYGPVLQAGLNAERQSMNTFSGGLGIRNRGWYLDIAYQYGIMQSTHAPYAGSNAVAQNTKETHMALCTFGLLFGGD